jgi:hypothetical protein
MAGYPMIIDCFRRLALPAREAIRADFVFRKFM